MKKVISLLLVGSVLVCALCGCGEKPKKDNEKAKTKESQVAQQGKEDDPSAYTYIVKPLQGVSNCVYYGPNDRVPNSPDPEAARNKIHIWTVCPTCGGEGAAWDYTIDVKDIDFSSGDTIQYSDSTSCYDCYWDRSIPSFMWSISIKREKIK